MPQVFIHPKLKILGELMSHSPKAEETVYKPMSHSPQPENCVQTHVSFFQS
jgi:hypothetical protein